MKTRSSQLKSAAILTTLVLAGTNALAQKSHSAPSDPVLSALKQMPNMHFLRKESYSLGANAYCTSYLFKSGSYWLNAMIDHPSDKNVKIVYVSALPNDPKKIKDAGFIRWNKTRAQASTYNGLSSFTHYSPVMGGLIRNVFKDNIPSSMMDGFPSSPKTVKKFTTQQQAESTKLWGKLIEVYQAVEKTLLNSRQSHDLKGITAKRFPKLTA